MAKTIYRITRMQTFEIIALLKDHGTLNGDGKYQFDNDWSDERIAKDVLITQGYKGDALAVTRNIRAEEFGPLLQVARAKPATNWHDVEIKLRALCKALDVNYDTLGNDE